MIHQLTQPSLRLQPYVKNYILLDFRFDKNLPTPVKPFPANTDHNLIFYLKGRITAHDPDTGHSQKFPKIAINGSQVSRFNFHLSPEYLMLGVNFHSGVMSQFLQMPLFEFTDQRIDAEAVLNPGISELYEQLVNTSSYNSLITILEDYILRRIQKIKIEFFPIDRVSAMINYDNSCSVVKLASAACLSVSQFERRFLQQTGITPKLFARINRFYYAYLLKDTQPGLNWLAIAIKAGYHDYQHLVKDFKTFAGSMPNSLIEAQAKAPERILGIG
jgi:AraC-like DNA-binding protein